MPTKTRNPKVVAEQKRKVRRELTASYDAAKTTSENRKHWANADDKPPAWANTAHTRQILRMRAQYEADNNSYCSGMIANIARDTVGYSPPSLQVLTTDKEFNRFVEDKWNEWSNSRYVNLPEKLIVADQGRRVQGENFVAIKSDKEALQFTGVDLSIDVLSASRVRDPLWSSGTITNGLYNDDGVHVDIKTGRPRKYTVSDPVSELTYGGFSGVTDTTVTVDSRYLLQWFSPKRAGQFRGVCEITPSLPLFAQLRRYDLATLTAAETASLLAGIMQTNSTANITEHVEVADWTKVELERGTLLTLPEGWSATQFKPEQPISAYEMFVNCFLRQIGRCLNIPFGVMVGDSSKYNYSSARLDYIGYDAQLQYDRGQLVIRILDPLFTEFIYELALMFPRVMAKLVGLTLPHTWQFTKRPSIDPQKDASTSTEKITNGTSNLAIECAKDGTNWEDVQDQRITEMLAWKDKLSKNGLTDPADSGTIDSNKANSSTTDKDGNTVDKDGNTVDKDGNTTDKDGNKTDTDGNPVIDSNKDSEGMSSGDMQANSLNGIQLTSLMAVIDQCVAKRYNTKTASILIRLAFPTMDKGMIEELVKEAFVYKPPEPKVEEIPVAPRKAEPVVSA